MTGEIKGGEKNGELVQNPGHNFSCELCACIIQFSREHTLIINSWVKITSVCTVNDTLNNSIIFFQFGINAINLQEELGEINVQQIKSNLPTVIVTFPETLFSDKGKGE